MCIYDNVPRCGVRSGVAELLVGICLALVDTKGGQGSPVSLHLSPHLWGANRPSLPLTQAPIPAVHEAARLAPIQPSGAFSAPNVFPTLSLAEAPPHPCHLRLCHPLLLNRPYPRALSPLTAHPRQVVGSTANFI